MKKSYLIPRRTFIKGSSALLALPLLEIMTSAVSYAKNKQSAKNLKMCVLFKGCGVNPSSWDIHGAAEDNFKLSPNLKPLEKYKKDILILSGLDSNQRANGGHPNAALTFMSGHLKKSRFVQNQTFDQMVADKIGNNTPLKSLVMRSDIYLDANDPCENYLSYDAKGNPLAVDENPEIIFNRLFRGFNNSEFRNSTASILDDAKDSYESVLRKASSNDKEVIDQYLDSVRDIEKNIQKFKSGNNSERDRKFAQIKNIPAVSNMADRTRAMLDLIALAFWTDMTRVATLLMSHTESRTCYDFIGVNDEMHYMSHFVRNRKVIPGYDKVNTWHVQQFAYFIDKLKSLKDGNATLFDNSAVMFGSGIKHGDYHSVSDIPLVLSGGAGGQIKLGRYVKYPNVKNGNLLVKLMDIMGVKGGNIGNTDGSLKGITEKAGFKSTTSDDGSWKVIKASGKQIEVKGLLKVLVTLEDPNQYMLQLSNGKDLKIKTSFMNIHKTKLDACAGSVVNLKGEFSVKKGDMIINKVASCKRY